MLGTLNAFAAYVMVISGVGIGAYFFLGDRRVALFWTVTTASWLGYQTQNILLQSMFWIGLLMVVFVAARIIVEVVTSGGNTA